jgi:hypothetical protein
MYVLIGLGGLVCAWFMFMLVTALWERQYLSGDVEPVTEPFPYPPSPYWRVTGGDARRLGFLHRGDFATKKTTTTVKGLHSLWMSPDGQMLLAIVSGSILGASLKKAVLRSRLSDGRILETSDNPTLEDMSGVITRAILLNAGLSELKQFHEKRLANSGTTVLPFPDGAGLSEYEKMDLERGSRLVEMRKARWADEQGASIRLTFQGAWDAVITGFFKQIRGLKPQQERINIPRAGS